MMRLCGFFILACAGVAMHMLPLHTSAQTVHQDLTEVLRAEVVRIVSDTEVTVPGTESVTRVQMVEALVTSGEREGETISFENDFVPLSTGQKFYLNHMQFIDGTELYMVRDLDRSRGIVLLVGLFLVVVIAFGGMQGIRSVLSLVGGFMVMVWVLFPLLLQGYSPLLLSFVIGSGILAVALFVTHGFNRRTSAALIGAMCAIGVTLFVALVGTDVLYLSGFFSDETVYLNLNTDGTLDFRGLLLGGIIIGVLGVLDDIAVTQVAVVAELRAANPNESRRTLFLRAMRVGKEHAAALVNTIVLAYTGVALPLLLFFAHADSSFLDIINNEIFATELARTIAGSIGLIAAVPTTTLVAVWWAERIGFGKRESHHHHHHGEHHVH